VVSPGGSGCSELGPPRWPSAPAWRPRSKARTPSRRKAAPRCLADSTSPSRKPQAGPHRDRPGRASGVTGGGPSCASAVNMSAICAPSWTSDRQFARRISRSARVGDAAGVPAGVARFPRRDVGPGRAGDSRASWYGRVPLLARDCACAFWAGCFQRSAHGPKEMSTCPILI
jgi:hypothetical protein